MTEIVIPKGWEEITIGYLKEGDKFWNGREFEKISFWPTRTGVARYLCVIRKKRKQP